MFGIGHQDVPLLSIVKKSEVRLLMPEESDLIKSNWADEKRSTVMDIQTTEQSRSPDGKKRVNYLVWVVCFIVTLMSVPWGIEKILSPSQLGRNEQSYLLLMVANQEGRYSVLKENAIVAHDLTDDSDLRDVARFLKDVATVAMQAGVDTFKEGDTFKGQAKMFIEGFLSPLKTGGMLWDFLFISKKIDRVDAKYEPIIIAYMEKQRQSEMTGRIVFWCIFVGGAIILLWVYKSRKAVS